MQDIIKELEKALLSGLAEAVRSKLTGYQSPLDKVLAIVIGENESKIRSLLNEALSSCLSEQQFRDDVAAAVRTNLAKLLVQRFGGELEKNVNALKSDPTTRARITLAIDEIVSGKK